LVIDKAEEELKAEEESLVNEELFQSSRSGVTIEPPRMKALAAKATQSSIWTNSTSSKDYKRMSIMSATNLLSLVALFKFFQDTYGIFAWWLHEFRTKYYLHQWNLLADKNLHGPDVEPSSLVEAGVSPLDSPMSTTSGSMAHSQIDFLVRDFLEGIFESEPFSANVVAAEGSLLGYTSPHFESLKESVQFFPGIIKTGMQPIHQELHIDNKDLIGGDFLEKVLAGQYDSLTDLDWMTAGYVVDMPLSKEGAWLRIAVPDPQHRRFVMDYIFIPYGSFVIRSMALFHSGHYGSPGNTRLHAVVFLKGATTNTAELGYLRTLVNKKSSSLAAGWKHDWSSQVKPKFQQAFSVMEYSNPSTGV
jgi:hypothetical protein